MKFLASLTLFASALALGCGCASTQPPTDGAAPTATVPVEPAPTASAAEAPPPADKPADTEAPPVEKPAGRLAFQACSDEARKATGCTKELMPVCGEVDNGIRCIKAPCPSTTPRTFPNACTACIEPKVKGYWAMSCEDMNKPTAP